MARPVVRALQRGEERPPRQLKQVRQSRTAFLLVRFLTCEILLARPVVRALHRGEERPASLSR